MKAESKEIIFGRYNNSNVVIKCWSQDYNSKLKFAPKLKIGKLISINFENSKATINTIEGNTEFNFFDLAIKLKPLSSISDKDVKLLGYNSAIGFKNGIEILELSQSESEILQQLGYATPQTVIEDGKVVTYSVEELVSEGIYKLI